MIESILSRHKVNLSVKISVKLALSIALISLAVGLPFLAHIIGGASAGITMLPMYLPVVLGGCILGKYWAMGVGVASPLASFLITSISGNAMPALARLPFMVAELAILGFVAGLFEKIITKNGVWAYLAVPVAFITARASFIGLVAIFSSVSTLSVSLIWSQIVSGMLAVAIQSIVVATIVCVASYILKRGKHE